MKEFKLELEKRTREVEEIVYRYLPQETGHQKNIFQAMNYSMKAGGKRLRPMLLQEVCRLFGGSLELAEPFMAAIEMIHTSSLIHDDLPCMDNDQYRRGKKSTWAAYGEDMGVLAGDALIVYAFETACRAFALSCCPERVGEAIRILAVKTGIYGMIGGQTVDVELAGKPVPREKLDFIYRLKTGALLEASMMIGAVLGGADEESVKRVEKAAGRIGIAFQIQDDILDITSSQEVLGKPVLSDEKNCKTTYVTLEGLEKAREDAASIFKEALEDIRALPGKNLFLEELVTMLVTREK